MFLKKEKTLVIIGTRPEAIKVAPIIFELKRHPYKIESILCSTGQHANMLQQVLDIFDLTPDIDLELMTHNQSLETLTANLFNALNQVIDQYQPDWILAQGDTTSVMVTSMLAFYKKIKFGHIEAGLRTGDIYSPFPEEANRKISDILATRLWTPTPHSKQNLISEGVPDNKILITGNTVVDALNIIKDTEMPVSNNIKNLTETTNKFILVTAHRRESFGEPILELCQALEEIIDRAHENVHIIYPVHLNPNVTEPIHNKLNNNSRIHLIDPVNYFDMLHLINSSYLILTDSGGIQEEAPSFGKPVLVLRDTTERPEGIEAGVAKLVGTDRERIINQTLELLENADEYRKMIGNRSPYGDGHSAEIIVNDIIDSRSYSE